MENLSTVDDGETLVDKFDNVNGQIHLESLGEIERQYAEHSVSRDAQLQTLQETVTKNDIILNELRAELKEKQMALERRTDLYTALLSQRNQILELRSQGQALSAAALNEEKTLKLDIKKADEILSTHSPWNDEELSAIASEEDSITASIDETIKSHHIAINDLKMIPKNLKCQFAMKKVCLDFQEETYNMIKVLKQLCEENETMLSEQIDLAAIKEEHDRLEALSAVKKKNVEELNMQRSEIRERIKMLKETNGKQVDDLNQVKFELEMHTGYQQQLDEKISELAELKEKSEQAIEAVNTEWNDCDTAHQERLNQLEVELKEKIEELEAMRKSNEVVKNEYADAKQGIVRNMDQRVRSAECQAKIEEFVSKKERVMAELEEMRGETVRVEKNAEEWEQSIKDCDLELQKIRGERITLNEQLEALSRQKENEENIATGLKKAEEDLLEEKSHLVELKKILTDGIQRVEEKINSLDLSSMDETDRANLKKPGIGEKMIADLANGLEKWKTEIKSLSDKGTTLADEKRNDSAKMLNDVKEKIEKVRNENFKIQEQVFEKRRSASNLDDQISELKRELSSLKKLKQNTLAEDRQYDWGSQDPYTNDENSDPNLRRTNHVLDSDSE